MFQVLTMMTTASKKNMNLILDNRWRLKSIRCSFVNWRNKVVHACVCVCMNCVQYLDVRHAVREENGVDSVCPFI